MNAESNDNGMPPESFKPKKKMAAKKPTLKVASRASNLVSVAISQDNKNYLQDVQKKTRQSMNFLVNRAIEICRSKDLLKSVEARIPTAVSKARDTLKKWETDYAAPKKKRS